MLTLSLPSRAVSIIFHYPASLCYAGLIVKSLVCIMFTISILCLHNCHVINNIRSNVDGSSPNGSLLCRMSPSRTELFVYFFKLIPVYYYEYACVCERVDSVCMSDWWGDDGGGFTSTREDVNGVEYQVVGSGRVSRNTHVCIRSYHFYVLTTINDQVLLEMKLCLVINCLITSLLLLIFDWKTFETSGIIINHSYLWRKRLIHGCNRFMSNTLITRVITHILSVYIYHSLLCYIYVQLIFITPYYFDISLVYKHLHIIFHIFISHKWLTMGLLKIFTYSSITMVTHECHFFLFFYYYVVIKFKFVYLFIDICLYYSTSSCTCMIIMTNYTVIYMFLNLLLIVSGSYITCIHVQSHYVLKGKLSEEGGSSASRVYQTYTYYG